MKKMFEVLGTIVIVSMLLAAVGISASPATATPVPVVTLSATGECEHVTVTGTYVPNGYAVGHSITMWVDGVYVGVDTKYFSSESVNVSYIITTPGTHSVKVQSYDFTTGPNWELSGEKVLEVTVAACHVECAPENQVAQAKVYGQWVDVPPAFGFSAWTEVVGHPGVFFHSGTMNISHPWSQDYKDNVTGKVCRTETGSDLDTRDFAEYKTGTTSLTPTNICQGWSDSKNFFDPDGVFYRHEFATGLWTQPYVLETATDIFGTTFNEPNVCQQTHRVELNTTSTCVGWGDTLYVDGSKQGQGAGTWQDPYTLESIGPFAYHLTENPSEVYQYYLNGVLSDASMVSGTTILEPTECLQTPPYKTCAETADQGWVYSGPAVDVGGPVWGDWVENPDGSFTRTGTQATSRPMYHYIVDAYDQAICSAEYKSEDGSRIVTEDKDAPPVVTWETVADCNGYQIDGYINGVPAFNTQGGWIEGQTEATFLFDSPENEALYGPAPVIVRSEVCPLSLVVPFHGYFVPHVLLYTSAELINGYGILVSTKPFASIENIMSTFKLTAIPADLRELCEGPVIQMNPNDTQGKWVCDLNLIDILANGRNGLRLPLLSNDGGPSLQKIYQQLLGWFK